VSLLPQVAQIPTPAPPLPPVADPTFMFERGSEMVMILVVLVAITFIAVKVLGPIARAWARKLEGKVGDPQIHADLDQMREQLGEVDSLRARVGELEERLEFTERLLTQRRDQDLLQRGGPGS
jgi:hypothetical protein